MRSLSPKAAITVLVISLLLFETAHATAVRDRSFTARTVSGTVTSVQHADEIRIGRLAVRLEGIAAPRLGKPLGVKAVSHINILALGKEVTCHLIGKRFRHAEVGTCRINGKDLARSLIREGLARSCPKIGFRRYTFHEARAEQTDIGAVFPLPRFCGPDPLRPNPETGS